MENPGRKGVTLKRGQYVLGRKNGRRKSIKNEEV